MNKRYISNQFGEKLIVEGKILNRYGTECDNGYAEMLTIQHSNGVEFLVFTINGKVIHVG